MNTETQAAASAAVFDHQLLTNLIMTVIIIAGAVVALVFVKFLANRITEKSKGRASFSGSVLAILRALIAMGAFLLILQANGVNVTAIFAGLGIATAVVGIAVQEPVRDMIAGMHVMKDKFYDIGDVLKLPDGRNCLVVDFNILTTKLEDLVTHDIISMSNREMSTATKASNCRDLVIGLGYGEDVTHVRQTLKAIAHHLGQTDHLESAVFMGACRFGESSILYKIKVYGKPADLYIYWCDFINLVQDDLESAGIVIPFNQLDLHVIPETERKEDD